MYKLSDTCQIKNLSEIYIKYFGYPYNGCFVEVGAYDGEFVSNTSGLADQGWFGLYIEPIEEHYIKCLERHKNNNIIVEKVAIGQEEKEITIFYGDTLTTLDSEQVIRYGEIEWSNHISFSERVCNQMRLDSILVSNQINKGFDLLVVDVEGKESEVFRAFDLVEWAPKMMIVELEDNHPSFASYLSKIEEIKNLREYILNSGYVEEYRDEINTVFVRNDLIQ